MLTTVRLSIIVMVLSISGDLFSQIRNNYFSASHPYFNYMGRVDSSQREYVRFDWPGVRVRFRFTGKELKLYFKGGQRNYFDLIVDEKRMGVFYASGDTVVEIEGIKGKGPHSVQFIKRTEGEMGEARFYGAAFYPEGKLLPWIGNSTRRIEFIGNSITCGYGSEALGRDEKFDPRTENVLKSYASIVANAFQADYHVVAHSGLGVVRNYGDNQPVSVNLATMPQRYSRILDMDDSSTWDFSSWCPGAVVINLGTNDFSTKPHPDKAIFQRKYEELILKVRNVYGSVPVFCLVGPMIDEPCFSYVKEMVENFKLVYNDSNVYFIGIPTELLNDKDDLGADWHPSYIGHQKIANFILPVMSNILKWNY
ncbi:SGNH/GDSL hydrolase family protein [Thermophagus sp. OGC60D27]|uniref:SGNH/GDSL hydrolase family protein n=1 Tax=Thermophagus sp. OGC60D27 TaxID=3458415 RepID=UPI004037FEB0